MHGALFTEFAMPDEPGLDAFTSGDPEVDAWFRSRRWFNAGKGVQSPPTYAFRAAKGGQTVGYASVGFRRVEHPDDRADARRRYLTIYAVGVNGAFQGARDPLCPERSYAESLFSVLVGLAAANDACVGLYLWVRANNPRAIRFYEKIGFSPDPAGPVPRDQGAPHLTMRKLLRSG